LAFVNAVLSKQVNRREVFEDFDVLYAALCSGNVDAVQEALRRTNIEEVPLRWLAHAGSNSAIDVCLSALPVTLDGSARVDGKRSTNASRLLHLLRFFSKQELRPYFTEEACLEVNGDMSAMGMAYNDREALLHLIDGKMHHNLFTKFFWHWSDDVVFEAWKAVGAHKQDLVKILQDGRIELTKKMLMRINGLTEQEAEKHLSILFGYGFVCDRAIESAIYRRAWHDVYQLHSFGQRPRRRAQEACTRHKKTYKTRLGLALRISKC
jgi:hypothetical protein